MLRTQEGENQSATPTTAAPTQKLIYNAQGQLAELRDAANVVIAKYVYRGDGKRAWKEMANGTRSYFYYSGEQMIAASNGDDASTLLLWGADGLIGSRSLNSTTGATSKSYNLYDPQGNLAQTLDGNGAVVSQSASNAWGEPLRDVNGNASGAGYGAKFGYVRDSESGFYLCTLRYYDASAGRWISRDPIGYAGGSDLYSYVGNDPVNAVDPEGTAPTSSQVSPLRSAPITTTAMQVLWYYFSKGADLDMNKHDPSGAARYFNHPSFLQQKAQWTSLLQRDIQIQMQRLHVGEKASYCFGYRGNTDVTWDRELFAIGRSMPYVNYHVTYKWYPSNKAYSATVSATYILKDRFEQPGKFHNYGYSGEFPLGTPYNFYAQSYETITIWEKGKFQGKP